MGDLCPPLIRLFNPAPLPRLRLSQTLHRTSCIPGICARCYPFLCTNRPLPCDRLRTSDISCKAHHPNQRSDHHTQDDQWKHPFVHPIINPVLAVRFLFAYRADLTALRDHLSAAHITVVIHSDHLPFIPNVVSMRNSLFRISSFSCNATQEQQSHETNSYVHSRNSAPDK